MDDKGTHDMDVIKKQVDLGLRAGLNITWAMITAMHVEQIASFEHATTSFDNMAIAIFNAVTEHMHSHVRLADD
jgi:hypothetical protein